MNHAEVIVRVGMQDPRRGRAELPSSCTIEGQGAGRGRSQTGRAAAARVSRPKGLQHLVKQSNPSSHPATGDSFPAHGQDCASERLTGIPDHHLQKEAVPLVFPKTPSLSIEEPAHDLAQTDPSG